MLTVSLQSFSIYCSLGKLAVTVPFQAIKCLAAKFGIRHVCAGRPFSAKSVSISALFASLCFISLYPSVRAFLILYLDCNILLGKSSLFYPVLIQQWRQEGLDP